MESESFSRIDVRRGAAGEIGVVHAADDLAARLLLDHADLLGRRSTARIDEDTGAEELRGVEAIFTLTPPDLDWSPAVRVRLIQSISVGADRLLPLRGLHSACAVATAAGLSARPMAEFAVASILSMAKQLPEAAELQRQRRWHRTRPRIVQGMTVAILGLGPVGRLAGQLLEALGMRCIGFRRRPGAVAEVSETRSLDELDAVLPEVDAVVVALPLVDATRRTLSRDRLRSMRPDAFIVNVARAGVVDEQALVDCLREGRLGGAVLDVVDNEPLDEDSPLWAVPGLHVTAHVSWTDPDYMRNTVRLLVENLERVERGVPVRNELDRMLGYPVIP